MHIYGLLQWLSSKESTCNAGEMSSIPELGRSPGERNGNPLQYSCLENPHGQKSLEGCSLWRRKELDTTEWLSTASHGQRSLAGYSPWGWKSVGHDLVTKQHQQNAFWKCFDLRGPFGTVENAHDCIYFHEIIGFWLFCSCWVMNEQLVSNDLTCCQE